MKITDLKCISIAGHPTVKIDTDEGISGVSQIEDFKDAYIIPHVKMYKASILATDPTDVARILLRIRHTWCIYPP